MSITEYKNSIKQIIDSTDKELLLRNWKKQIEWDLEHFQETELSAEEWNLVQEGLTDYENGDVLSLTRFMSKR